MTVVLDTAKTAAYATAGVNLLVADAVIEGVRKNQIDVLGHLGQPGVKAKQFLDQNRIETPEAVEAFASKARDTANDTITEVRSLATPVADDIARLPERVGTLVTSGRVQIWDLLGIESATPQPAVKPKKAKKTKSSAKAKSSKAKKSKSAKTPKASKAETVSTAVTDVDPEVATGE